MTPSGHPIAKGKGAVDAVEVHHTVEKWIQDMLGLPMTDDVPGAVLFKKTGAPDGHAKLQGILKAEIRGLTHNDEIVATLRRVYQSREEWKLLWPVSEAWLKSKGIRIP